MNDCSCEFITEWVPTQHFDSDSEPKMWLDYFQCSSNTVQINNNREYDICRAHYANMYKIIGTRVCKICENNASPEWVLGKSLLDALGPLKEDSEVAPSDWICEGCFKSTIYPSSGHKTHKFASARDGALDYTLKVLEEEGVCLAKCVMDKYKELITTKYEVHDIADSEYANYQKILKIIIETKGHMCYCPSKKSGIMYYNPSIINEERYISLVYKILNKNDNSVALPDTERIRNMVKRQATLFPESSKFDYRTLFEERKECTLDKYFDKELLDIIDSITTSSDWSIHTKKTSPTHTHMIES